MKMNMIGTQTKLSSLPLKYLMLSGVGFTLILFLCFTTCNTPRLKGYAIHGIDVSHYQGKVAWATVKQNDFRFALAKTSEGLTLVDSRFEENWTQMSKVGIVRGAYHFFRPSLDAKRQAELFLKTVDLHRGDLVPVLDIEVTGGQKKAVIRKRMKTWLDIVENKYKVKPIIYTYRKYYEDIIKGFFDNYPLWIADYNRREAKMKQREIQWSFWQYSDRGRVPGVQGYVDMNVFYGNLEQFYEIRIAREI